jgi:hypothetical protein
MAVDQQFALTLAIPDAAEITSLQPTISSRCRVLHGDRPRC